MGLDVMINAVLRDKNDKPIIGFEICYWRKCYGIRDDIIRYLEDDCNATNIRIADVYELDDIMNIIKDHAKGESKETYSFWDAKTYRKINKGNYKSLKKYIEMWNICGDYLPCFYRYLKTLEANTFDYGIINEKDKFLIKLGKKINEHPEEYTITYELINSY